jgi:hypothetical protein
MYIVRLTLAVHELLSTFSQLIADQKLKSPLYSATEKNEYEITWLLSVSYKCSLRIARLTFAVYESLPIFNIVKSHRKRKSPLCGNTYQKYRDKSIGCRRFPISVPYTSLVCFLSFSRYDRFSVL